VHTYDRGGFEVKPLQSSADGLDVEAEVVNCTSKVDFFAISDNHAELDFLSSDDLREVLRVICSPSTSYFVYVVREVVKYNLDGQVREGIIGDVEYIRKLQFRLRDSANFEEQLDSILVEVHHLVVS
jgi:hypothetical protein